MKSFERHSFDRIKSDWEEAKAQIMGSVSPQRLGSVMASGLRGVPVGDAAGTFAMAAPPQDAMIIDMLMREPLTQPLVQRIGSLSCESCSPYRGELEECWDIVSYVLEPSPVKVVCGAIRYLQSRFADEVRERVYRSMDARLGGIPDAWSLVRANGRVMFGSASFPCAASHVWYAAFVAARGGFSELLMELPDRTAPHSDRCPMLRTVCTLLAGRLQAASGQLQSFPASSVDSADLLQADLSKEGDVFHDVLVHLLLGRSFAFGRLPEGTVEDWMWFRLHALQIASGDSDQAPEFSHHLETLRQHALAVPPSYYDPSSSGGPAHAGAGPAPSTCLGFWSTSAGATGAQALGNSGPQTLNFAKVLLLTAQFGRAVQQLWSQDHSLHGPALHIALVLHRSGALEAMAAPERPPNLAGLVCDYAGHFSCGDQLRYFRALDPEERAQALQKLLLRGGVGTNEDLVGHIDATGRHRPGLLERTLHEDGLGDWAEFADLCARAGRAACEQGQYREALRLLHLGRCHGEVLQVLCRCLRLPIWREASPLAVDEATVLDQDVRRFFAIYERNLDRYALSSQSWAVARRLYAARLFSALCRRGQPEAAVDLFDREQLLPLGSEWHAQGNGEGGADMLAEYPRIVADYVRILRHAAAQGVVVADALTERVRHLRQFLAVHSHHLTLDRETVATLGELTLC